MQSGDGPPTISLQLVPKVLEPLVSLWVPEAYVVSFKLETDQAILIDKSRKALKNYSHQVSFFISLFFIQCKFICDLCN
jgi:phosphopantothenate-cysteine ligase